MSKIKKVLLVGTYCGLNKGDRLMQSVLAEQLQSADNTVQVLLASPFPLIDKKLYPNIQIIKAGRRNLPFSTLKILSLLVLPDFLRKKFILRNTELRIMNDVDLIVDVSGDMLTEDYGPHVAFSHAIPLILALLLKKPYIIAPQSIGPFKIFKKLYLHLLQKAEKVLCREDISFDYLTNLKLTNTVRVEDLGFLLQPEEITASPEGDFFCVAPSGLLLNKFRQDSDTKNLVRDMAKLFDTLATKYKLVPVLIPHVMTPSAKMDDDEVCRILASEMSSNPVLIDRGISPNQVKHIVSKANFMIAFRMHAAIAALGSHVPTIAVAYSHKTHGVMQSCGFKNFVVDNDKNALENINIKTNEIMQNREFLINSLELSIPKVKEKALTSIEIVRQALYA